MQGLDLTAVRPRNISPAARKSVSWVSILLALAFSSFVLALVLEEGRWALALAGGGTLAASIASYLGMARWAPRLAFARVFPVISAWNALWIVVLALVADETVTRAGMVIDYAEHPFLSTTPLLATPAAALCLCLIAGLFAPTAARKPSLLAIADRAPLPGLGAFHVLGASALLAYWVGSVLPGFAGYIIRIMSTSLGMMPYVGGRYVRNSTTMRNYWLICLAVNGVGGLFTGGRYRSLLPPALYLTGRMTWAPRVIRRRLALLAMAVALPVLFVSGAIGVTRSEFGRVGADKVDAKRVETMTDAVVGQLGGADRGGGSLATALETGVRRMVPEANLVVPVAASDIVPYRGFDGFEHEIGEHFSLALLSGVSREDYIDRGLGTGPANMFGFTVDERNSVEFGLIPDAWSRGGGWALFLFAAVFTLILTFFEMLLIVLSRRSRALALLLFAVGLEVCVAATAKPLLASIRTLLLNSSFVLALGAAILIVSWVVPRSARPNHAP